MRSVLLWHQFFNLYFNRERIGAQPWSTRPAGRAAAGERREPDSRVEHRLHHNKLRGRETELGAAPVGPTPHPPTNLPAAAPELPPSHPLPPQHCRRRGAARGLRLERHCQQLVLPIRVKGTGAHQERTARGTRARPRRALQDRQARGKGEQGAFRQAQKICPGIK